MLDIIGQRELQSFLLPTTVVVKYLSRKYFEAAGERNIRRQESRQLERASFQKHTEKTTFADIQRQHHFSGIQRKQHLQTSRDSIISVAYRENTFRHPETASFQWHTEKTLSDILRQHHFSGIQRRHFQTS